ncbi:DUF2889 domain-containing protein [Marinobacter sp.]|uniref:DUF2889 domain-containing protein n=1 Tax=Marinobacter sp. TaxID=50741 RepID=UPI003BAA7DE5
MLFRRRIEINAVSQDEIRATLEDDFHHFRVAIRYANGKVTDVHGFADRYPYSACPAAADPLKSLVGMELSEIAHSVTRYTDARHQCTHMLDLAGLVIANANRQSDKLLYDIVVPMRVNDKTKAELRRNGKPYLTWNVEKTIITSPPPYDGVDLNHGMARWAIDHLSPEESEAALVLRRSVIISRGRERNLDLQEHARPLGVCFSQQPVRAEQAIRVKGSTLDFTNAPELLCAEDETWLYGNTHS